MTATTNKVSFGDFLSVLVRNDDPQEQRRLTLESFGKLYDEYMAQRLTDNEQISELVGRFFDENPGITIAKPAIASWVCQELKVPATGTVAMQKVVGTWLSEHTTDKPLMVNEKQADGSVKPVPSRDCFYSGKGPQGGTRRWADIPAAEAEKLVKARVEATTKRALTQQVEKELEERAKKAAAEAAKATQG